MHNSDVPHPAVRSWRASLAEDVSLPNAELFAYPVVYAQSLVGLALVLGLLTRLTAEFGLSMNLAFMWSGAMAANPPFIILQFAIVVLGAVSAGVLFAALLPRIATDWPTWPGAAALAVAVAIVNVVGPSSLSAGDRR